MDWSKLLGPLTAMGAPVLGKIIGSIIPIPGGALIGEAAGRLLASALGVDPTPEAVNTALTTSSADIVLAKVKAAEAEAVAKWPALAEMAKAQAEAETQEFQAQIDDTKSARDRDVSIRTLSGGVNTRANLMLGGAFSCLVIILIGLFFYRASIPDGVAAILNTSCGMLLTMITQAFNFEFGSTRASGQKSDQQQATMEKLVDKATAGSVT